MSNSTQAADTGLIIDTIETNYYVVAGLALYSYDYLITFHHEIRLIWHRRFAGVSILLLLNRYLPFVKMTLQLLSSSPLPELNQTQSCRQQAIWGAIVHLISNIVFALLPALRVYAIWGRSWPCFLSVLFIGLVNTVLAVMREIPYTVYSLFPAVYGCWTAPAPFMTGRITERSTFGSLASITTQDVLVLILTWARTYQVKGLAMNTRIQTPLLSLLLRDGTTFFGMILAVNVVGMVAYMDQNMPLGAAYGMQVITGIMQPMLLSRFMFGLREAYLPDESDDTSFSIGPYHLSSVRFNSTLVGNIGAPLADGDLDNDLDKYADEEREPPPVTCDDPFVAGLIEKAVETTYTPHEASPSESPINDVILLTSSSV